MKQTPWEKLVANTRRVLGKNGCAWCRRISLFRWTQYLEEEVGELRKAIRQKDFDEAAEELGDILWVALLLAERARIDKKFSLTKSLQQARAKSTRRHPQVFAGLKLKNMRELVEMYEKIKQKEKEKKDRQKKQRLKKRHVLMRENHGPAKPTSIAR